MTRIQHQLLFAVAAAALGLATFTCVWQANDPAARIRPETATATATAAAAVTAAPQHGDPNCRETAASTALGFYGAPVGTTMRHAFAMATTVQLATQNSGNSELVVDLAGELALLVMARRGGELLVELRLPEVRGVTVVNGVRSAIAPDSAFADGLQQATLVRMSDAGETLGFRFVDDLMPEQRNFVRGLWSSLRFLPRECPSWTARERDGTGTGEVEYTWEQVAADGPFAGELRKALRGYAANPADYGVATGDGDGAACFDRALGWHSSAHWRESVRRDFTEIGVVGHATTRVHTQLIDAGFGDVATVAAWDGAWQPVANDGAAELDRRELARQAGRLADTTVEGLLADLAAMARRGELEGHDGARLHADLVWLLRTQPEALVRLQRLLPGLDPKLAGAAIAAIGATQLPASQTLLAELFADGSQAGSTRLSAAMAMVQVQRPDAPAMQAMLAAVRNDARVDTIAVAGWLALGTLAERAEPALQATALAGLLALEGRAVDHGAVHGWLEALGNAGAGAALAAAERYRADPSVAVRVGTVSAVRRVAGDAAWRFAAAALLDEEPAVRVRAVEVLASRSEAGALAAIGAHVGGDSDARVRRAAVEALAGRAGESAVRSILQQLAAGDPEAAVRASAAAALGAS